MTRRLFLAAAVFWVALAIRTGGPRLIGPYDDAYHWKRIAWVASHSDPVAHGMTALDFDRDRGVGGEFCPWPPLYDLAMGGIARIAGVPAIPWIPPLAFSLFAALLTVIPSVSEGSGGTGGAQRMNVSPGLVAGLTVAIAPYLAGISRLGSIDHHWAEPLLVVAILFGVARPSFTTENAEASLLSARSAVNQHVRDAATLAAAMIAALFVQTALIVACGLAMLAIVLFRRERAAPGAIAFAITAAAVALYRMTRPAGYPDNAWFLGWTHVALLAAAAVACAAATRWPRWIALACGAIVIAPFAHGVASGARFFAGDSWLQSIVEFQPMFRDPSRIGTDLANIGGGLFALLVAMTFDSVGQDARRAGGRDARSPFAITALFASVYFVLAISSRRFLVPAIALFAIAGAFAAMSRRRSVAIIAVAATLLPPIAWNAYALTHHEHPANDPVIALAAEAAPLPPGRVLAPWHTGHAIDVFGRHAVVIDNFGSMPDAALFTAANRALLETDPAKLAAWCRAHGVMYLALTDPARQIPAAAVCAGFDRSLYAGQPLAARTVWSRLWRGERVAGYSRVGAHVWRIGP